MRPRLTRRNENVFESDSGVAARFCNPFGKLGRASRTPGVAASRRPQAVLRDAVGVVPVQCGHPHNAVHLIPAQREADDSLGLGR
jgi:hypothetical protein